MLSRKSGRALCVLGALLLQCANPCEARQRSTPSSSEAKFVSVTGNVRSPLRIAWSSDLTLLTAVMACGGFSGLRAPRQVFIVRGTERIAITLGPIRKQQEPDPKLQPGDKIEVP